MALMFEQRPPGLEPDVLYGWLDKVLRNPRYGSWTPTITFVTPGDLTVVYSTQIGRYAKIGIITILTFNIVTSTFTHTTASGNLRITGNPFTSFNLGGVNILGIGPLTFGGITKAGYTNAACRIIENTTIINAEMSGSALAASVVTATDMPTTGTVRLNGSLIFPSFTGG